MKNDYKISEDGEYIIIYLKDHNKNIFQTFIDAEDFDKVNKYQGTYFKKFDIYTNDYYAVISLYIKIEDGKHKTRIVRLNRIIMDCNDSLMTVDHIFGNTLDNRKKNLRIATIRMNTQNRQRINRNNTSGYRNVCYFKGWYLVQLQINGKNKVLGRFKNINEAGIFAQEMRNKYYQK